MFDDICLKWGRDHEFIFESVNTIIINIFLQLSIGWGPKFIVNEGFYVRNEGGQ